MHGEVLISPLALVALTLALLVVGAVCGVLLFNLANPTKVAPSVLGNPAPSKPAKSAVSDYIGGPPPKVSVISLSDEEEAKREAKRREQSYS